MTYLLKSGGKTVIEVNSKAVSNVNGVSVMCGLRPAAAGSPPALHGNVQARVYENPCVV